MIAKNLKQYKMVLFDFDDTLYVHKNHILGLTDEEQIPYDISMIRGKAETEEEPGEKCEQLDKFMKLCKDAGCSIGLLSSTLSFKHMLAKELWVIDNYKNSKNIENFSVGRTEDKIRMLKTIKIERRCKNGEMLLIDDDWITLAKANYEGIHSACPLEVVNYILKEENKESCQ